MAKSKTNSKSRPRSEAQGQPEVLKGWKQIAGFLGEPVSVVQRWSATGMPVRREWQFVSITPTELNDWLAQQSESPCMLSRMRAT